ncbi:MAG: phosphomannomutase/phosphoglucomutase [Bacteroidales bacterium]
MSAFHAYDIRGVWEEDFGPEEVYRIGWFLPQVLNAKRVLIGRDCRVSSPEIHRRLCKGITDAGADVYDAGLTTTPMIYWGTAKYDMDASVMITASHNDPEYNGLKVSGREVTPIGYANGLNRIEELVKSDEPCTPQHSGGKIISLSVMDDYLAFQRQYSPGTISMKVAIDCSDGMAGLIVKELLGSGPLYINDRPDGRFPHHSPNPLVAKNRQQLVQTVIKNQCDLGIIFDGDADRVMFVDERGEFISPDLMIALMGHWFFSKPGSGAPVIQDIRSSRSVAAYLSKWKTRMITWRVGRAFAAQRLRQENGLFGGELAGHYYFKDFYYSDSAMMAAQIILKVLNDFHLNGEKVSDVIRRIATWYNSGELNFRIENKSGAMKEVRDYFLSNETPLSYADFDGFRLDFEKWWFNIRPSNTEPYLRLLVEADNRELLDKKTGEIKEILERYK